MQSHLANVSLHPEPQVPPGTSAGIPTTQGEGLGSVQANALLASARESNQSMRELTAAVNAIITGQPGAILPRLLSLLCAVPDMCSPEAQLAAALSQVGTLALIRNEGRRAASFFISRGEHLGQALDSGGSDHIAGQRDASLAYEWNLLRDPIPVMTANGVVYATWECTIPTILGPMRCYYLDNGGPPQSLLSVDKLCREGEFTNLAEEAPPRV